MPPISLPPASRGAKRYPTVGVCLARLQTFSTTGCSKTAPDRAGRSSDIWKADRRLDTRLTSLKQHLAAIAVMFDFVNPMLAFGRFLDRRSTLRLDKAKPINDAGHALNLVGAAKIASPCFQLPHFGRVHQPQAAWVRGQPGTIAAWHAP